LVPDRARFAPSSTTRRENGEIAGIAKASSGQVYKIVERGTYISLEEKASLKGGEKKDFPQLRYVSKNYTSSGRRTFMGKEDSPQINKGQKKKNINSKSD